MERDKHIYIKIWSIFEENIMTALQISGISQNEFEQRLLNTIEIVNGSPIVKHKQKIVKKAMTTLLHGGSNAGQNEHNLSQFFNEATTNSISTWRVTETYKYENGLDNDIESYEGKTENEALLEMYSSVLYYLSDCVEASVNILDIQNLTQNLGFDYVGFYFDEHSVNADSIEYHQIAEIIRDISNTKNVAILTATFKYIVNLSCVEGTHNIEEIILDAPKIEKQEDKSIKLYKIIKKSFGFDDNGTGMVLEDVDVYIQTNLEEHNEELIKLFKQYGDQNDGSFFELADLFENLLEDNELEANDFDDFDDLTDWILRQDVEPNEMIEHIATLSMNHYELEVSYEEKNIKAKDFL